MDLSVEGADRLISQPELSEEQRAKTLVRLARPSDLDAVEALEKAVFHSDQLSRRSLRYYIGAPTAAFLVMERDSDIVGDAIIGFRQRSTVARLYSIAIGATMVGRGLGTALLAACEQAALVRGATRLRLEVRADNASAIRLYARAGYTAFGQYPDYYEDGAAALRFERPLPKTAQNASV